MSSAGLSKGQKLRAAEKAKEAGNLQFKQGATLNALDRYQESLDHINILKSNHKRVVDLHVSVHLNMAQCYFKKGAVNAQKAHASANAALELDPSNIKGFFRRGRASRLLKKYAEAQNDLIVCLEEMKALELCTEQEREDLKASIEGELKTVEKILAPPEPKPEPKKPEPVVEKPDPKQMYMVDDDSGPREEKPVLFQVLKGIENSGFYESKEGGGKESEAIQNALRKLVQVACNKLNRKELVQMGSIDLIMKRVLPHHRGEVAVILAMVLALDILGMCEEGLANTVGHPNFGNYISTLFAFLDHRKDCDDEVVRTCLRTIMNLKNNKEVDAVIEKNDHMKDLIKVTTHELL